ncbi:MAG: R2-like ligand-binding oxidase [Anaerolineales bacterium]
MPHTTFQTTTRGLDRSAFPMRLYEKAKKFGIWNPTEIDLQDDRRDWQALTPTEQTVILHLTALFQAGEEAVTLDLLPLIQIIAEQGRIEEEIYLTTFLFEEAKHTDFFRRFLDEVTGSPGDLTRFHGDAYHQVFYHALPQALGALRTQKDAATLARAAVTYNLIVEGVLAETGYHAFYSMLERNNLMPGLRRGIGLLKQDESRHIAYGIYLLSRLLNEDASLWETLETHMNSLLLPALGVISDIFSQYEAMPFGLREEDFVEYATDQFSKRFERLERARDGIAADLDN